MPPKATTRFVYPLLLGISLASTAPVRADPAPAAAPDDDVAKCLAKGDQRCAVNKLHHELEGTKDDAKAAELKARIGQIKHDGAQSSLTAASQPDVASDPVQAYFLTSTACWLECPDATAKLCQDRAGLAQASLLAKAHAAKDAGTLDVAADELSKAMQVRRTPEIESQLLQARQAALLGKLKSDTEALATLLDSEQKFAEPALTDLDAIRGLLKTYRPIIEKANGAPKKLKALDGYMKKVDEARKAVAKGQEGLAKGLGPTREFLAAQGSPHPPDHLDLKASEGDLHKAIGQLKNVEHDLKGRLTKSLGGLSKSVAGWLADAAASAKPKADGIAGALEGIGTAIAGSVGPAAAKDALDKLISPLADSVDKPLEKMNDALSAYVPKVARIASFKIRPPDHEAPCTEHLPELRLPEGGPADPAAAPATAAIPPR